MNTETVYLNPASGAKPDVLVINSYGGSLTMAANQEGHHIIASMEDHNFGLDSQRLNFPDLDYRPNLTDWPMDLDLRDRIVIAHPPCSGFSSQNRSKKEHGRGFTSEAFQCTTRILEYVMPREPEAIAIESVPGAMQGARHVHDFYAKTHGYDLYRVLQNAASFGVPQWRRRFWAIFVKQRPGRRQKFTFWIRHNVKYLQDVLPLSGQDDLDPSCVNRWNKQLVFAKELGYDEPTFRGMLTGEKGYGNLIHILADLTGTKKTKKWPCYGDLHSKVVGGNFLSGALHVLDPKGFAPVLLGPAWWWCNDRMLGYSDYKLIMGFPADYRYHRPRLTFVLLSKGVCPPVARWILRETCANVFGIDRPDDTHDNPDILSELHLHQGVTIDPGEVADLRTPVKYKEQPHDQAA